MQFPSTPEVIVAVNALTKRGRERHYGDRIAGVSVKQPHHAREGFVQIDIRAFDGATTNLTVRVGLPELLAAIASAAINRDSEL